jgi:hypothetical protein
MSMPLHPDFSLIVQGPSLKVEQKQFLAQLDYYKRTFGQVIISTWSGLSSLEANDGYVLLTMPLPGNVQFGLIGNTYYQICSIYYGLREVKTEFVIKCRTDASFGSLEKLVAAIRTNPDRLVCGDVFFKSPKCGTAYHIGDHVFGSKTIRLMACIKDSIEYCKSNTPDWAHPTEVIIGHAFAQQFEEIGTLSPEEIMRRHFLVVPVSNFKPFVMHQNSKNLVYCDSVKFPEGESIIHDINEL